MYNILVIDDDPDVLEVLCEMLKDHYDCELEVAVDGEDALLKAGQRKFDLVCTDYRMPIMNGGKLIVFLRGRPGPNQQTPILIITGYSDEVQQYPKGLDKVFFINKPTVAKDFYASIDKAIASASSD